MWYVHLRISCCLHFEVNYLSRMCITIQHPLLETLTLKVYEHPEASEKEFPFQKHWTWRIFVFDLFWFYLVSWCIVLMLSNRFEDFDCQGEASHVVQWGQQGALARHFFLFFGFVDFVVGNVENVPNSTSLLGWWWLKPRSGPRLKTSSTSWITSGCPCYWVCLREVTTHIHTHTKSSRLSGAMAIVLAQSRLRIWTSLTLWPQHWKLLQPGTKLH